MTELAYVLCVAIPSLLAWDAWRRRLAGLAADRAVAVKIDEAREFVQVLKNEVAKDLEAMDERVRDLERTVLEGTI